MMKHKSIAVISALFSAWFLSTGVLAQSYPSKPVTMVVPQAAGGTNDIVAR
jgi:tripartite-type tricarboxylate transporter receptor subunit TctC